MTIDLPVTIESGSFRHALHARTRDLSATGACLATPGPIDLKEVRWLSIPLENAETRFAVEGLWQQEDPREGVVLNGFSFEAPTTDQSRTLWDLVFDRGRSIARFLHEHTTLHELGLDEAMGLSGVTRMRRIAAGQYVYRQGDRDPRNGSLFIIRHGSVTLQIRLRDSIDAPFLELERGALIGGLPQLANIAPPETAVASRDLELYEIDAKAFRHLRITRPWLAQQLSAAVLRVHAERMGRALESAARCF